MRRYLCGGLAALTTFAGVASASAAPPPFAYDKAGAAPEQVIADMQTCLDKAAHVPINSSAVFVPNPYGAIAAGIVLAVSAGVQRAHAMAVQQDLCMLAHGYARVPLTEEETAAFHKAGRDPQHVWLKAFLSQDLSARIAEAQANTPKMAPQLEPQPFAVAGVQIDPASLKLTDGVMSEDSVVLTASAAHRATAVLNDDVEAKAGLLRVSMKAGTMLYAVDPSGLRSREQTTLWCGPSSGHAFGRDHASTACLFSTDKGDQILPAFGYDWMMSPEDIPAAVKPLPLTAGKLDLTVSPDDQIGPMTLTLQVATIDEDETHLSAFVEHGGKKVKIWTGVAKFDKTHVAVLPFWTKRLVMTRRYGSTVGEFKFQAALSDDGRGGGWMTPDPVVAKAPPASDKGAGL